MNKQSRSTAMDQKIFNMGLCVETVSAYLLCCGLVDADTSITTKNLLGIWNGSKDALLTGLYDLEKRNIINKIISDRKDNFVYRLKDAGQWSDQ